MSTIGIILILRIQIPFGSGDLVSTTWMQGLTKKVNGYTFIGTMISLEKKCPPPLENSRELGYSREGLRHMAYLTSNQQCYLQQRQVGYIISASIVFNSLFYLSFFVRPSWVCHACMGQSSYDLQRNDGQSWCVVGSQQPPKLLVQLQSFSQANVC